MLGKPVDYDELAATVPLDPVKGSTLLDLRDAAARQDVEMSVRHVTPGDLIDLPVPFIMHLELADVGGSGHFVSVFGVIDSAHGPILRFIDGGSGAVTHRDNGHSTVSESPVHRIPVSELNWIRHALCRFTTGKPATKLACISGGSKCPGCGVAKSAVGRL